MTTVAEHQDIYLSHFTRLESELPGQDQPWLSQIRQQAIHRFAELGFPTTRREEWKYTNVAPIARIPFQPAQPDASGVTLESLRGLPLGELASDRLVFVNGHWRPELSSLEELPKGVNVRSLATVLRANGAGRLQQHLARYASYEDEAFVALNTAFLADGAFVQVDPGLVVARPIHLLYLSTAEAGREQVAHPRNLIVVGASSEATVVETYLGLGEGTYFVNAVTEIVADENAVVDHYKIQHESETAFHIATLQVQQGRNSTFVSNSLSFGGRLIRNDAHAVLDGPGGHCALNGLYLVGGTQHVDNHTLLDHAQPHCTSLELYKGILADRATGVFNGAIVVRKDAQKTDAVQRNKNLLLSRDALINTKPQLEIFADDVRCTHGATIGQLDSDALFYLRARGIPDEAARRLLLVGFAREILDLMKNVAVREGLEGLLSARLAAQPTAQEAR